MFWGRVCERLLISAVPVASPRVGAGGGASRCRAGVVSTDGTRLDLSAGDPSTVDHIVDPMVPVDRSSPLLAAHVLLKLPADAVAVRGAKPGRGHQRLRHAGNRWPQPLTPSVAGLKRSAFNLRHQLKADRMQRLNRTLHSANIRETGFSRNALFVVIKEGMMPP